MSEKIIVQIDSEIRELVPKFMENRLRELEKIRLDVAGRRFDAVRLIGHTMAGVGSSYGFDDVTRIGRDLQLAARAEDSARIGQLADDLESYLSRVEPSYI